MSCSSGAMAGSPGLSRKTPDRALEWARRCGLGISRECRGLMSGNVVDWSMGSVALVRGGGIGAARERLAVPPRPGTGGGCGGG